MRRATRWIAPVSLAVVLCLFGHAHGQPVDMDTKASTVSVIDGIGLLDRFGEPQFKIGTWTKYHASGSSLSGNVSEYDLVLTIGGEEVFWGEDCFWLETASEPAGQPPITIATLMSYAIFDPKHASAPASYYQRKTVMEMDDDENPIQSILKRPTSSLTSPDKAKGLTLVIDTLGTETIRTPAGEFECLKVRETKGLGTTEERGDSTHYMEHRETRTTYHSRKVPITGLVRTDIEVTEQIKTWKVGQSAEVPMMLVDRSNLRSDLLGFGEGREASVTPKACRRPIKRTRPTARR